MPSIHLPRWEELPNIELYKEQVLELLELYLKPLGVRPITASMINNYTKLNLIPAPIKKKYSRKHLAHIFIIALLKDVFEISEIVRGINLEKGILGRDIAYNIFVKEVEDSIDCMLNKKTIAAFIEANESDKERNVMRYAALSFAIHRYTRNLINEKGDKNE
ncbi:MAG: DUF1836 domain-containing protein [Erysipelotrichaceae bacterium]|jgi:DNA-binding transcriptional MerR regulator|nr:DUF1836 domain-containing protein [Erysipelotrichaceae bacterium]